MKLVASLLLSSAVVAAELSATSSFGQNVLKHARRLEQNDQEEEETAAWLSAYSLKFQGCHNVKQWNEDADGEEDVKISTTSLIRFRMCPADSCSATKAAGCTSGFGDYVVDMATFMENYFEAVQEQTEAKCENYLYSQCNCEDGDDQDDGFDKDFCEYDCFNDAEMYECIERNPYDDDEEERQFELQEYLECRQLEVQDNDNGRKLEDANEEEVQYFVGPHCANQGGSINLGLFTDDTCSTMAEDIDFEETFGFELPYESTSLVESACVECVEPVRQEDQNDNDQQDADAVIESCENLYTRAGKCESKLPDGMVYEKNENACNYMDGIRIVRQDGIIDTGSSRPSAVATAFIVVAAMAFCAMAFYVWYLRTRLGVKKDSLL